MLAKFFFNKIVTAIGLIIFSMVIMNSAKLGYFFISGISIGILSLWNYFEGFYNGRKK